MEGNYNKNQFIQNFSDFFIEKSFDEEEFHQLASCKKSYLRKPSNEKYYKTLYFPHEKNKSIIQNKLEENINLEQIYWHKSILILNQEKVNEYKGK